MAKKKITSELEEAILNLPLKEKNKLLIRLIGKDPVLTEQLRYKLLENTESDLVFRRAEIKERLTKIFGDHSIYYFKDLLYYVRDGVSYINRHFKITRDKKGELELLIHLYQQAMNTRHTLKNNWRDQGFKVKFTEYSQAKLAKMNTLLNDLHEDFRVEYEEDITTLSTFITDL
ncbi:hypothetical protein [Leadbetterella sp. DM7]|uniref:hypothetical protein n=1 Tax=Leadbetterella sp. DM7 TaxID=3235085 RepID=UPI00349E79C9